MGFKSTMESAVKIGRTSFDDVTPGTLLHEELVLSFFQEAEDQWEILVEADIASVFMWLSPGCFAEASTGKALYDAIAQVLSPLIAQEFDSYTGHLPHDDQEEERLDTLSRARDINLEMSVVASA